MVSLVTDPSCRVTPGHFIDLCALVCFNFLRTLRSSRSCTGHPRGLQFSDFLYHSPSHTVSPTHSWHFLSCGAQTVASAPSRSILLCISTSSRASSKTTPEPDMLWLWENEKIDKSHSCVRESEEFRVRDFLPRGHNESFVSHWTDLGFVSHDNALVFG